MKVLVTGATGFVGSAVVKTLRQKDHEVVGLVRDVNKGKALEALGAKLAAGDMMQPSSYEGLVSTVDAVIHTAQYGIKGRFTNPKLQQIIQAEEIMTQALAQACVTHDKRFIYTSGCFNYGDCGDEWITEQSPMKPSPLGIAHTKMVEMLLPLYRDKNLRVTIITPGFVYGPGGLFKQALYDTFQKGQLRVFGQGTNYWSSVHVNDLAAAYCLAVEGQAYGETFFVVDDQPLHLRDLVDMFTDAMGKKRVGTIPPFLLKLIIGGPLVESLITSFRLKNDKAKSGLGWQPRYRSFKDGLPEVLSALKPA